MKRNWNATVYVFFVLEHVSILNILAYLGTKPVFRFMSEFVTLIDRLHGFSNIANFGNNQEL